MWVYTRKIKQSLHEILEKSLFKLGGALDDGFLDV